MRWLEWGWNRSTPGAVGAFHKAYSSFGGRKIYYKSSRFDPQTGASGRESINELIADRLMRVLGVPHVSYDLIHADISKIQSDGGSPRTVVCAPGEIPLA